MIFFRNVGRHFPNHIRIVMSSDISDSQPAEVQTFCLPVLLVEGLRIGLDFADVDDLAWENESLVVVELLLHILMQDLSNSLNSSFI
jgi:hypothetical protein